MLAIYDSFRIDAAHGPSVVRHHSIGTMLPLVPAAKQFRYGSIRVGLAAYRRLPLYPYKQTSLPCVGMSQRCQKPPLRRVEIRKTARGGGRPENLTKATPSGR